MKTKHLMSSLALMGTIAVCACGGSSNDGDLSSGGSGGTSGSGGSGGAGVPVDELPQRYAAAACGAIEDCVGNLFQFFTNGEDCETLSEREFREGTLGQLKQDIDDGKIVYDGTKAEACFTALRARGCDLFVAGTTPECDAAIDGTVESGGECDNTGQCKGDLYCNANGMCPGTCTARGPAGSDCRSNDHCQDGLVCSEDTEKCVQPSKKGESCGGGVEPDCVGGLLCSGEDEDMGTPGTCDDADQVFVGKVGDTCSFDTGTFCDLGLSCVVQSFTPPQTIDLRCAEASSSGGACKWGFPDPCPDDEYCDADPESGSFDGTCQTLPTAGQPCVDSIGGIGCAPFHRCVDGTCASLQENGGQCSDDEACYSGNCDGGGCAGGDACSEWEADSSAN